MIKANRLEPKPDLMISEIIGNGRSGRRMLLNLRWMRGIRFLAPGGRLLPYQLDLPCVWV
jgi:hypothetical protein